MVWYDCGVGVEYEVCVDFVVGDVIEVLVYVGG